MIGVALVTGLNIVLTPPAVSLESRRRSRSSRISSLPDPAGRDARRRSTRRCWTGSSSCPASSSSSARSGRRGRRSRQFHAGDSGPTTHQRSPRCAISRSSPARSPPAGRGARACDYRRRARPGSTPRARRVRQRGEPDDDGGRHLHRRVGQRLVLHRLRCGRPARPPAVGGVPEAGCRRVRGRHPSPGQRVADRQPGDYRHRPGGPDGDGDQRLRRDPADGPGSAGPGDADRRAGHRQHAGAVGAGARPGVGAAPGGSGRWPVARSSGWSPWRPWSSRFSERCSAWWSASGSARWSSRPSRTRA